MQIRRVRGHARRANRAYPLARSFARVKECSNNGGRRRRHGDCAAAAAFRKSNFRAVLSVCGNHGAIGRDRARGGEGGVHVNAST